MPASIGGRAAAAAAAAASLQPDQVRTRCCLSSASDVWRIGPCGKGLYEYVASWLTVLQQVPCGLPKHGAACSHDSLEGLFFDDTYRPSATTAEFTTSLPQGLPAGSSPTDSATADQRLVFSSRCGRIRLANVTVRNAGIDWGSGNNIYWRHMVKVSSS
jgi:hypothetical protein